MKSRFERRLGVVLLTGFAAACGNGISSTGPSAVATPTATPSVPSSSVTFVAFLDENGNGTLDSSEQTRIPNAEVVAGSAKGTTASLTGQVTMQVPQGSQTVTVTAGSLPPFYRPPASVTLSVPASGTVNLPITLPLGSGLRPNVYMAFGDSITNGEPEVGDGNGYRLLLQAKLRSYFGTGTTFNEGIDATRSDAGAARLGASLNRVQPAFTLIFYGVNDYNDTACFLERLPCFTTSSIRSMIQQVNARGGHAFVATITPVNVGYDDRAPASRNDWAAQQNVYIRQVADQEGAVLVDLNGAFLNSGIPNSQLFVDHVHPQAVGYEIMAQTWFNAITKPYSRILSDY